ncbi:aspartate/glutamate racemase family protein [Chelatococcus composti]|uniref:Asp/Glu/hydantoin racemase n=1 Tax=Chelatococcus composti TaxID=1743235 RepID=A0A841KBK5_9HYPH|nr:aspartate/glutamate racemase family protein [Chelatococcus composti]MBB6168782.1 Asp/Glu/hydantoin racemase [Chelatococcus composti]MBS7737389.1 aspartate/glutamate racemase family protein [Chelatococcus composti]GGG42815.1 hydantoin racemase [Chelatococcus composti]
MVHIVLFNPNSNEATTDTMVAIAREAAGTSAMITGRTAPFGARMIVDQAALSKSGEAIAQMAQDLAEEIAAGKQRVDAVIVSAFGDPGLDAARKILPCPVIGIGESGMSEAAAGGRAFSVVTTTPGLVEAINARAAALGYGAQFRGTRLTEGDPTELTAAPARLEAALAAAVDAAVEEDGAEAVIIGGGPLARVAKLLTPRSSVPIIEPVPAAVRRAIGLASAAA